MAPGDPGPGGPLSWAAVSLLYQDLDDQTARAFRLLGVLPPPDFTHWVAAEALGDDADTAKELLGHLVDAQLLDGPSELDRYRFRKVPRLFALERLGRDEPSESRDAAQLRALRWYDNAAWIRARLLEPEGRSNLPEGVGARLLRASRRLDPRGLPWPGLSDDLDPAVVLGWFEEERLGLVAAVDAAFDTGMWELTWSITRSLTSFFSCVHAGMIACTRTSWR